MRKRVMIYVLEIYSIKDNKKHPLMYSENLIKLNKFIDLTIEYFTDWNFCSRTFREFCVDRCSDDWLDDFASLVSFIIASIVSFISSLLSPSDPFPPAYRDW